jgi:DNA-directed RNA polymerase specialized sigma24 family protein
LSLGRSRHRRLDRDRRFASGVGAMLSPDQFMDIALLYKEGRSLREIAKLTGHSRSTIRRNGRVSALGALSEKQIRLSRG